MLPPWRWLRAAFDRGVTFFDTAQIYGPLNERRSSARRWSPSARRSSSPPSSGSSRGAATVSRSSIAVRRPSARPPRAHSRGCGSRPSTSSTSTASIPNVPIEDVAGTVGELIQEGKVKHFGLSEAGVEDHPTSARRLARRRAPERVLAVVARARGRDRCRRAEELGIGFVPFSPLGKGFLTGTIDETTTFASTDFRNIVPRFTADNRKANQALVEPRGRRWRSERAPRPRRSRWRGCWRRSHGSCPSPARRSWRASKRTSARRRHLTADDLREIDIASVADRGAWRAVLRRRAAHDRSVIGFVSDRTKGKP